MAALTNYALAHIISYDLAVSMEALYTFPALAAITGLVLLAATPALITLTLLIPISTQPTTATTSGLSGDQSVALLGKFFQQVAEA